MSAFSGELKRLFRHSAIFGLSNMLGKAIGFLLIPLYTHYIPASDYGILELLDLGINVMGMFVGMGIVASIARFYHYYDDREDKAAVVSTAIFSLLVIAFSFSLVMCLCFSEHIARILLGSSDFNLFVQVSLVNFAFNAILEIPLLHFRITEQSLLYGVASLLRLLLALALNILFVVYFEMGVFGILCSGLTVSLIFAFVLTIQCLRSVGLVVKFKFLCQMISFGAPLILNSVGMFIIHFGDRFLLKMSASMAVVGIYSLGYKIGMGVVTYLITQPFYLIWSVRCYELVKEEGGMVRYGQIFSVYSFILLISWLALTAFSKEIVNIIAPVEYQDAGKLIPLIALGYLFRSFSDYFRSAILVVGKTKVSGLITSVVTLYCVINYYVLIPKFQAIGAACATVSTFVIMAFVNWFFSVKYISIDFRERRVGVGTIIVIVFGTILHNFQSNSSVASLAVIKMVSLMFCSFLLSFVLLYSQERKIFFNKILKLKFFVVK